MTHNQHHKKNTHDLPQNAFFSCLHIENLNHQVRFPYNFPGARSLNIGVNLSHKELVEGNRFKKSLLVNCGVKMGKACISFPEINTK